MKVLLVFILILSSAMSQVKNNLVTTQLRGKEGGNGQLVVTPKGHSKPVPYEAVRAWETGKYRNFYKLPGINGNIEPRSKFNKAYAVHALEWLEMIKGLSDKLYNDLIGAAKTTSFRIVDEYIHWEHKPYPEGELAYKKYEKAAFYNGEIILSTPVMDRIGPLGNVLTAEQNQGFIVIHELINAAMPGLTVAEKLDIGEALIRVKAFGDTKEDFKLNLMIVSVGFLEMADSIEETEERFRTVARYSKDQNIKSYMYHLIDVIKAYNPSETVLINFTRFFIEQSNTIRTYSGDRYYSSYDIEKNYRLARKLYVSKIRNLFGIEQKKISFEEIQKLSQITGYKMHYLEDLLKDVLKYDYSNAEEVLAELKAHIEAKKDLERERFKKAFIETDLMKRAVAEEYSYPKKSAPVWGLWRLNKMFRFDIEHKDVQEEFNNVITEALILFDDEDNILGPFLKIKLSTFFADQYMEVFKKLRKEIAAYLSLPNKAIDVEKTEKFYDWYKKSNEGLNYPILKGDKIQRISYAGRDSKVLYYNIKKSRAERKNYVEALTKNYTRKIKVYVRSEFKEVFFIK